MSAADIGGARAGLKSLNETAECWQPATDKVHVVAGAKEALGSVEQARVMLTPFHPLAGAKILQCLIAHVKQIAHDFIRPGKIDRSVRIRKTSALLFVQEVALRRRLIFDIAPCGLVAKPLARVTLVGASLFRE